MRLVIMAGRLLLVVWMALSTTVQARASEVLHLLTNIAPPYQEMVNGELGGTSLRALDCIMDRLDQRYEVDLAPWLRAREQVRQGAVAGIFSVAPDPEGPRDGHLSLPLALERWVWVTPAGIRLVKMDLHQRRRIAAVLGSNQLKWLRGQGRDVDGMARTSTQLLRMLAAGRVEAVLMDQAELLSAIKQAGADPAQFQVSFQRYMPLGVYFAAPFLRSNPHFLERFNGEIGHCAAANMVLTASERGLALAVARQVHDRLLTEPSLLPALKAAGRLNADKPVSRIVEEDQIFQSHRAAADHSLVWSLRDHPLSTALARLRAATGGVVSEILLFDNAGVAVAADPLPSDLWQADEAKYAMTVAKGADTIFVDNIAFDQSTGQFNVQVSFAIAGDKPGSVLGGVTIGLDIERTLNRH
ncbi:substrate-binding periplasmic protein [Niveispirillum fermenti]|uniref:substrate-binding periplasmic protein n=1 Tax=Niveispirillum fermenti TaxID=1233113 RepID=UPI003A86F99A